MIPSFLSSLTLQSSAISRNADFGPNRVRVYFRRPRCPTFSHASASDGRSFTGPTRWEFSTRFPSDDRVTKQQNSHVIPLAYCFLRNHPCGFAISVCSPLSGSQGLPHRNLHHAIRGPLTDLAQLALLIEAKLNGTRPGSTIRIREEFAKDSSYALILDVREDDFDPASADSLLSAES
jgi:hypothetical protein